MLFWGLTVYVSLLLISMSLQALVCQPHLWWRNPFTHEGYSLTRPYPPDFVWWQSFLGIQSSCGGFSSNLGLWPPLPEVSYWVWAGLAWDTFKQHLYLLSPFRVLVTIKTGVSVNTEIILTFSSTVRNIPRGRIRSIRQRICNMED